MTFYFEGNNKAIKKLLHVAVSDVNDDVRRAAVMSLGFLLFKTPEQVLIFTTCMDSRRSTVGHVWIWRPF